MYFSVKNWWSFKLFKFFYIYHVKNTDVADMTSLPNIGDIITKRRHTLFGHVVRLDTTTPAHQALEQVVATKAGRCPGTDWETQPVGDRCGRTPRNVDIAKSLRNGPQPTTRHDGDDDDGDRVIVSGLN